MGCPAQWWRCWLVSSVSPAGTCVHLSVIAASLLLVSPCRGEVINGGFGLLLDGSNEAAERASLMLNWDVSNGVRVRTGNEPVTLNIRVV